ncbi:MAG: HAD family hydrolase [Treponema sp.]|jgi:Cof subfamily protein (haloacid dehalogenase superfamily)|nr:HAD family hydrolase [Treponema sp.]
MGNKLKTLYISDLDGTLLNKDSKLSEYSVKTLNGLIDSGMIFSYATARSLSSALVVTNGLKTNTPLIIYNGTFIVDPKTQKILFSLYFNDYEKNKIMDLLNKYSIYPLVYKHINDEEKVSWIEGKENDGIIDLLNKRIGDKRYVSVKNVDQLYYGNVFYFTCIGAKYELINAYNELNLNLECTCVLQQELYRPEYWFQIMHKNANKGNAIKKLKEIANCEKIISFGDAINDIPMFQNSDECYAVENAVEEIKSKSTGIILSNNNDGVVQWLNKHYKK